MRTRNTGYNVPYGMGSYLGSLLSPIASYPIDSKTFRYPKHIAIQKLPYQLNTFLYDPTRVAKNGIPAVFFCRKWIHFSYVDWARFRFHEFAQQCSLNPLLRKMGIPECILTVTTRYKYRMWRHHPTGCEVIALEALVSILEKTPGKLC